MCSVSSMCWSNIRKKEAEISLAHSAFYGDCYNFCSFFSFNIYLYGELEGRRESIKSIKRFSRFVLLLLCVIVKGMSVVIVKHEWIHRELFHWMGIYFGKKVILGNFGTKKANFGTWEANFGFKKPSLVQKVGLVKIGTVHHYLSLSLNVSTPVTINLLNPIYIRLLDRHNEIRQ